jgi:hypothetical protein
LTDGTTRTTRRLHDSYKEGLMPRGVYDRSKRTTKTEKAPKTKAVKKTKSAKSAKPRTIKIWDISTEGRFHVLTENISAMVEVLSLDVDKEFFSMAVRELARNFSALRELRQQVFGGDSEEPEQTVTPSNGGNPKLPSKPLIPVPPIPPST